MHKALDSGSFFLAIGMMADDALSPKASAAFQSIRAGLNYKF